MCVPGDVSDSHGLYHSLWLVANTLPGCWCMEILLIPDIWFRMAAAAKQQPLLMMITHD